MRTLDGLRMRVDGGTDGQLLTLIGDRVPGDPDLPEGKVDYGPGSPWAGMSGAVVVSHGMVIGVIRSHHLRKGFQLLNVTPLTALKLLPAGKYREFCAALGIEDIDQLTLLTGDPQSMAAVGSTTGGMIAAGNGLQQVLIDSGELSDKVRERYAPELVVAGLAIPNRWDFETLDLLRRDCQHKTINQGASDELKRAAETLKALCFASAALPALAQVGRKIISTKKLQYLYLRHVGCWPEVNSLEEMLILAASVGVKESRPATFERSHQPEPLTAIARFLLGIAGHWKGPGPVTLDDPHLRDLAALVTGPLGQQQDDAMQYLASMRRRTWALIELVAPDFATRDWPTVVIVDSVSDRGDTESRAFECASRSRAGMEEALRDAVNWLPEGDVHIDLCLPRHWLDAGLEHWPVVDAGGQYESLNPDYKPRLRWAMHRNHPILRDRLRKRFEGVDWLADAENVPAEVSSEEAKLADWLAGRDQPGTKYPPFLTGGAPRAGDHDPLGTLLRKGYGCITWFSAETAVNIWQDALRAAAGLSGRERRDDLPELLAVALRPHRPAIIWSDPNGRADFPMPPPRPAGSLRRGRR
jgi:hypothetical protein